MVVRVEAMTLLYIPNFLNKHLPWLLAQKGVKIAEKN
jgi:hypothetical protein